MQSAAQIQAFRDEAANTVTYLVSDPATRQAAVIDPGARLRPPLRPGVDRIGDAVFVGGTLFMPGLRHCAPTSLRQRQHLSLIPIRSFC